MQPAQWQNYFFTANFTDVAAFLQDREENFIFQGDEAATLAAIFQSHDRRKTREAWNADRQACDYNLVGALVVYNGPNSPSYPTNSKYTHVMTLQFNEGGFVPQGVMYLQYNRES